MGSACYVAPGSNLTLLGTKGKAYQTGGEVWAKWRKEHCDCAYCETLAQTKSRSNSGSRREAETKVSRGKQPRRVEQDNQKERTTKAGGVTAKRKASVKVQRTGSTPIRRKGTRLPRRTTNRDKRTR